MTKADEAIKGACGVFADQLINGIKQMKCNATLNIMSDLITTFDGDTVAYPSRKKAIICRRLKNGPAMDRINLERDMIVALNIEYGYRKISKK